MGVKLAAVMAGESQPRPVGVQKAALFVNMPFVRIR
jgi:hypothetical protein